MKKSPEEIKEEKRIRTINFWKETLKKFEIKEN